MNFPASESLLAYSPRAQNLRSRHTESYQISPKENEPSGEGIRSRLSFTRGTRVRKALILVIAALLFAAVGCGGGKIGATSSKDVSAPAKFTAGIAHVAGNYGFSQSNFLVEGAQKISQLGSDSIFVYLTP